MIKINLRQLIIAGCFLCSLILLITVISWKSPDAFLNKSEDLFSTRIISTTTNEIAPERGLFPPKKNEDPEVKALGAIEEAFIPLIQNDLVEELEKEIEKITPKIHETDDRAPSTLTECEGILTSAYFYLDETKPAVRILRDLLSKGNNEEVALLKSIACEPQAIWIVGGEPEIVEKRVHDIVIDSETKNRIPVFVLYNVPDHKKIVWYSGVGNGALYTSWVEAVAKGIGDKKAWIILEPDALLLSFDYTSEDRALRRSELRNAVEILTSRSSNVRVYIDAGHGLWKDSVRVSEALKEVGIEKAHGFSTNVSNFQWLNSELAFGKALSALVGGKHFVIDTSRNGDGPLDGYIWCNPKERALGYAPTYFGDEHTIVDAYLWIKSPGESDGTCNGGPSAGQFWLAYAMDLVRNKK